MSTSQAINQMLQAMTPKQGDTTSFVFGRVASVSPLQIIIDNRLTLTKDFVILSVLCRQSPFWRGLQEGDTVVMIKSDGLYYAVERNGMEVTA